MTRGYVARHSASPTLGTLEWIFFLALPFSKSANGIEAGVFIYKMVSEVKYNESKR